MFLQHLSLVVNKQKAKKKLVHCTELRFRMLQCIALYCFLLEWTHFGFVFGFFDFIYLLIAECMKMVILCLFPPGVTKILAKCDEVTN